MKIACTTHHLLEPKHTAGDSKRNSQQTKQLHGIACIGLYKKKILAKYTTGLLTGYGEILSKNYTQYVVTLSTHTLGFSAKLS